MSDSYRREVRENGYSEREWLDILLDGHDTWLGTMEQVTAANAQLMFWTQGLLGVSLLCLFLAATLLAMGW